MTIVFVSSQFLQDGSKQVQSLQSQLMELDKVSAAEYFILSMSPSRYGRHLFIYY